jgi:gliding motility-associated-like protein
MLKGNLFHSFLSCSIWIFLLPLFSYSQNTYFKTVGNSASDFGTSCKKTYDEGSILTLVTSTTGIDIHIGLVKADYNGTVQWSKLFQVGEWSVPQNVLLTPDSGYLIFGSATDSFDINLHNNFLFLLNTDSAGNEQWMKKIPVSSSDMAVQCIRSKSGGYVACSVADYNTAVSPRAVLTHFDEAGNILWQKQYSAPFGLQVRGIAELSNGDISFIASSASYSPFFFNDALVALTDSMGNLVWTKVFSTYYDDEPNAMAVNSSDEIFITGRSYFISRNWDSFLLKLDRHGNRLLSRFYDAGTSNGEIMRCILAKDNGSCSLLGDVGTFNERDITLLSLGVNADINWVHRYPFSPAYTNYPYEMYFADDGGFVFTGDVRPPSYPRDAAIVKTDKDGSIGCYDASANFTVYNDTFQDTLVVLTVSASPGTVQSSSSTVPVNLLIPKLICENPVPIPGFTYTTNVNCPDACVNFFDESLNQPTSWLWQFPGADSSVSILQHPSSICYPSPGTYTVTVIVSNAYGTTSISKILSLQFNCPENEEPIFIPNVFTPDGDNKNDEFIIRGLENEFTLHIFNRWGEEIFRSSDQSKNWNGRNKSNVEVSEGVYFYTLILPGKKLNGFVELIR